MNEIEILDFNRVCKNTSSTSSKISYLEDLLGYGSVLVGSYCYQ